MSNTDIKYNLTNRALKAIEQAFGYEHDNKGKIKILDRYFRDLQFNNSDLYNKDKITSIEDKQYFNFITRMLKSTFHKHLKDKNIIEVYPNIVGEIYALLYSKQNRSCAGQFFTPSQVANEIMLECKNYFDIDSIRTIYDPCCGAGSLPIAYSNLYNDVEIYINELPYVETFYKLNFNLHETNITDITENMSSDLCLLNPPFTNNDVMNFLEIASESGYLILMLPTSFDNSRNYKKSYQYFIDNFDVLGVKKLDSDCFSWHGVAVNTMVFYCINKYVKKEAITIEPIDTIKEIVIIEPIKEASKIIDKPIKKITSKKQTVKIEGTKKTIKTKYKKQSINIVSIKETPKIETRNNDIDDFLEKIKTINFIIRRSA